MQQPFPDSTYQYYIPLFEPFNFSLPGLEICSSLSLTRHISVIGSIVVQIGVPDVITFFDVLVWSVFLHAKCIYLHKGIALCLVNPVHPWANVKLPSFPILDCFPRAAVETVCHNYEDLIVIDVGCLDFRAKLPLVRLLQAHGSGWAAPVEPIQVLVTVRSE